PDQPPEYSEKLEDVKLGHKGQDQSNSNAAPSAIYVPHGVNTRKHQTSRELHPANSFRIRELKEAKGGEK
ncbi:MAG: hypothetical protein ABJC05_00240, partial [Pyrinomonadaceae bacterium]